MRIAVFTLLVVASCLSPASAQSQRRPSAMIDVALDGEGHLSSRCEDAEGSPVSDTDVELLSDQQKIAWTKSTLDGSFVLRDVKPGTYRLKCGDCDRSIRVWSHSTAPPAAHIPIVIVVGIADVVDVADQPVAHDEVSSPTAAGQPTSDSQELVLPLEIQEGDRRRTDNDLLPNPAAASPNATVETLGSDESDEQNTHAHHTVESTVADTAFDPFAGSGFEAPPPDAPLSAPPLQQQITPTVQAPIPPAQTAVAPAYEPVPQELPQSGSVRYIRRSVGPTVGDVVVTSFGIAGITMGIVAIHKYDNRRIKRVVSP